MAVRLGKYLLLDRINQGGMADVFAAKAFGFGGADHIVALKCIRESISNEEGFVDMFIDEAKLCVQLNHDNIAQVFELGRTDVNYYIAMEYVSGRDLRTVIKRSRERNRHLPPSLVLYMTAKVLEGLDYAHRKTDLTGKALSIVHRDVSPHNVIIGYGGDVKLIDFGIAKAATQVSKTNPGVLRGKYGYMSPEQVLGQPVQATSDIFSTGALLFELLTQQRVFRGSSDFSTMERIRYAEVFPPSLVFPNISPEVDDIVLKALALEAKDRFPSASDMHDTVVAVMLKCYGPPSKRQVATLMAELFEEEIEADLAMLEKARSLTLADAEATELSIFIEGPTPSPQDKTQTIVGIFESTQPNTPVDTQEESDPVGSNLRRPQVTVRAPQSLAPLRDDNAVMEDTNPGIESSEASEQTSEITMPLESKSSESKPAGTPDPTTIRTVATSRFGRFTRRELKLVVGALAIGIALVAVSWFFSSRGIQNAGRITVESIPSGAKVLIDGIEVGKTPYRSHPLPTGQHKVVVRKRGFRAATQVIDVAPNEIRSVQVIFQGNKS